MIKQFGTSTELELFVEQMQNMKMEIELLKEDFDNRLRLDTYRRVIIKVYNLMYKYRATGKKMDIGRSCVRFKNISDLPLDLIGETISLITLEDFLNIYKKSRKH